MKKVVVGLSGGVDSAVSALLLKRQGYAVHGVFMNNWSSRDEAGICPNEVNWRTVQNICQTIDITCSKVDCQKEYWTDVFEPFVESLSKGLTPNPDIGCNSHIKFGAFRDKCKQFESDYIAFGHYARKIVVGDKLYLARAKDLRKDQTFYLSHISSSVLKNTLFPLGDLMKTEVKQIAIDNGLSDIAAQKESMGICFIGKRKFGPFVSQYVPQKPGNYVNTSGDVIGRFPGLSYATIGQKARIPGLGFVKWYVTSKDLNNNTMTVVDSKDHSALFKKQIDIEWTSNFDIQPSAGVFSIKIRQQSEVVSANLLDAGNGKYRLTFETPQYGIAPGQHLAIYDGELCLGGALVLE